MTVYDFIYFVFLHAVDKAFLMYAERSSIQYLDLTNNNHSTQIDGLRGAVAVAYDMREEYIFWADMKDHMIFRRKFNGTGKIFEIFVLKRIPLSKCL